VPEAGLAVRGKLPNEFTLMDATAKLVAGYGQRRLLGVVLLESD
jgi:hypothetical protein